MLELSNLIKPGRPVIVLAPHTDDGEFGCGGSIARFIEHGLDVIYVAFSAAEDSLPSHLPKDTLRKEVVAATNCLGIKEDRCLVHNFQVRRFYERRQEILDEMIVLNRKFNPGLVMLPSISDTHQDHQVIAQEGFRAFKRTTMLAYDIPWNNLSFKTSCFIHLNDEHVSLKVKALGYYESQKSRPYCNEEFIRSLAITRGTQIGMKFAEAFEVVRLVL